MMKLNRLILLLSLLTLLGYSCGQENRSEDQHLLSAVKAEINEQVNKFLLDMVHRHDIVLLGEGAHNQKVYHQKLIEFLHYWLDQAIIGESPARLSLVLELPHEFAKKFEAFFADGNIARFSYDPHFILNATVADLEFFFDLRHLIEMVATANRQRGPQEMIEFEILCPEKDMPVMASREERDAFFKTERDIYTASQIEQEMKNKPAARFLGVFGLFHIIKKRTSDNIPRLAEQLVHKNIKLYSIYLSSHSDSPLSMEFESVDKDFVVPITAIDHLNTSLKNELIDAWVCYHDSLFPDLIVNNIPSINVIRNYVDYAKVYPDAYTAPLLGFWQRFTGGSRPPGIDPIEYVEKHIADLHMVQSVDAMLIFQNIIEAQASWHIDTGYMNQVMLNITGYSPRQKDHLPSTTASFREFWSDYLTQNGPAVKIRMLTAILFYGTKDESAEAICKLKEIARQDFETPKEWLNWYRANN